MPIIDKLQGMMKADIYQRVLYPVCCLGLAGVLLAGSFGYAETSDLEERYRRFAGYAETSDLAGHRRFAQYLSLRRQLFESMLQNSSVKEQLHILHELRFRFRDLSNMDKLLLRGMEKIPLFADELLKRTANNILEDASWQKEVYDRNVVKMAHCESLQRIFPEDEMSENDIKECQAAQKFKQLYDKNLSYMSECNNYIDNLEFHGWCRLTGCLRIHLLSDSDVEMRLKMIMKLGGITDDKDIDAENVSANPEVHQKIAVALMCDSNRHVRRNAAYALLAFAKYQNLSHQVVPQLENALQNSDLYVQAMVGETLKLIRSPVLDKTGKETED